ncbi:MAG: hypothetical protein E6K80_03395 [Candidatus Eisenbacteria bacterium]|uniref:Uncharacterized protein n=1 Tax=Eiseniibacteriota bacterium TaxID=2212470 RepID=A0A538U8G6_UNCEI|nr:MAG: hypothetical protein E6K80_03395 [Candidatus Eisenbacteria bacterium]
MRRIWPGDLERCERFRRIPFSNTSPRASRSQTREPFERGCAEASAYLKILTLELETQGVAKPRTDAPASKPATLPADLVGGPRDEEPSSHDPRDLFEPSPLDRAPSEPPTPSAPTPRARPAPDQPRPEPPRLTRRSGRRQLRDMLGFGEELGPKGAAPRPAPPVVPGVQATPPSHPPLAPSARDESSLGTPAPAPAFGPPLEAGVDPELEDMLSKAEDGAFQPSPDPAGSQAESAPSKDLQIEFLHRPKRPQTPAPPAPRPAVPAVPAPAPSPAAPAPAALPAVPLAANRLTSPAPAPAPFPAPAAVLAETPREPIETTSPTATALVALAGQVDRFEVPAGQRAATRAALVDFARQLDEGIASFDSIREILWVVADYPALARCVIPLLVPHLDLD